jgi:hypothetical protein
LSLSKFLIQQVNTKHRRDFSWRGFMIQLLQTAGLADYNFVLYLF